MFRYMPRAGYRSGEKRVDVWLSQVQHGHLRGLAEEWDCSLSDAVGRLLVEEVVRRGSGGDRSGVGRHSVADRGFSGAVAGGDGEDHVGVGVGDGDDSFVGVPGWAREILESAPRSVRHLRSVDSGPIIGDEFIDLP